ncbi:MAG: carboxypeptidase regulatory-like domain-containing protein, partial [Bacteroidia bacterium]|nr:carboxypeptidase regulatory-like domain-containing protein [Bacteroidia bacterium]
MTIAIACIDSAHGQEARKRRVKPAKDRVSSAPSVPADAPSASESRPSRGFGATIYGKVIDEVKGEPLAAATVKLSDGEKLRGVITDDEGYFAFRDLPAGTYTITFEYPEYQTVVLRDVVVADGDFVNAGTVMKEAIMELEAIFIQDRLNPSGDAATVLMQKTALAVSDGLSGNLMIKQSPDFQLSVPLQRLPGVSMNEDKYLSVRGLFERYNSFTINNAPIPVGVDP